MDEHWLTRSEWLVGTDGLDKLKKSTVLVAGLGGVGSYAAEMLARAGVGHLILIDNDKVT
ncbi:MAG TPA: ThiF family adenylyltransferase, partial [Bacteroidales bacterium]|nr:ThiF family adenylyltransferase [Bacteroidales bacterium]